MTWHDLLLDAKRLGITDAELGAMLRWAVSQASADAGVVLLVAEQIEDKAIALRQGREIDESIPERWRA